MVGQVHLVLDAALAAEAERDARAADVDVPAAHRRQAEGAVVARVLVVPDPDQRCLEQPDDGREDPLARQPAPPEVRVGAGAQLRERSANSARRAYFVSSRVSFQRSWYRYCLRPR